MPINISSQFNLSAQLPLRKYSVVDDLTARNAIPDINRYRGFESYVLSEDVTYRLVGGITNEYWQISFSGSVDWDDVTGTPTTESAYGITDGFTSWDKDYSDLDNKPSIPSSLSDIGESYSSINYWTKLGDNVNYSSGKIGVNKTSPVYHLDVGGGVRGEVLRANGNTDSIAEWKLGVTGDALIRGDIRAVDGEIKTNSNLITESNLYVNNQRLFESNGTLLVNYNSGGDFRYFGGTLNEKFKINTSGNVIATSFIKNGGTSSQFLKADGTVDINDYSEYNQVSVSSDSTPNPTGGHKENEYYLTALSVNATFASPSGTPVNGNSLLIRIKDNGSSRTLNWHSIYRVVGVNLPTATTLGKTIYVGCIYNSTDSKWDVVSVIEQI